MTGLRTAVLAALLFACEPLSAAEPSAERGAYVFDAAGCYSCHTDVEAEGAPLVGGRALASPFGTFYAPNITPDPEHGIGAWTERDFIRALREGRSPDGRHYYPAFPYTSYTRMTEADMRDLWAYLRTVDPVAQPDRPHGVAFPFSWRFGLFGWKWLNFEPGPFEPDPALTEQENRGAYLVRAVAHCGECHTPRGLLGGLERSMHLAGVEEGSGFGGTPNITPDPATGIGEWSRDDLLFLLQFGIAADGDVVGGEMSEVVEHTTSKLSAADREAIVSYLLAIPPIEHRVGKPEPTE